MSTPSPVTGYVLAGGQSTRMGADKALLEWHGTSLLDHMTRLLQSVTLQVHVVGRDHLPDRLPHLGPIGGILTALLASPTDQLLVVAVDLPLLTPAFLQYLLRSHIDHDARLTACKSGSEIPLCLAMTRSLAADAQAYIDSGGRSILGFIDHVDAQIVSPITGTHADFNPCFGNVNTRDEYLAALKRSKS